MGIKSLDEERGVTNISNIRENSQVHIGHCVSEVAAPPNIFTKTSKTWLNYFNFRISLHPDGSFVWLPMNNDILKAESKGHKSRRNLQILHQILEANVLSNMK